MPTDPSPDPREADAAPLTEAGRRLLKQEAYNSRSFPLITVEAILAIEADAAQDVPPDGLRAAAERAASLLDHLAEYDRLSYSHTQCGDEPLGHAPLSVEAAFVRAALATHEPEERHG